MSMFQYYKYKYKGKNKEINKVYTELYFTNQIFTNLNCIA